MLRVWLLLHMSYYNTNGYIIVFIKIGPWLPCNLINVKPMFYFDTDMGVLVELEQKLLTVERDFAELDLDRRIEEMKQARSVQVIHSLQSFQSQDTFICK